MTRNIEDITAAVKDSSRFIPKLIQLEIMEQRQRKKLFHANGVDTIDIRTDRSVTQP